MMKQQYRTPKVRVGTVKKSMAAIDSFPMIAQKGQPALGGLRVLGRSFHPAGNGSFRQVEAEHQEFAMDARRTQLGLSATM